MEYELINSKDSEKDFWDDLPQYVKDGVKKSLKQAREGLVTPHEEVMKKYQKYLDFKA